LVGCYAIPNRHSIQRSYQTGLVPTCPPGGSSCGLNSNRCVNKGLSVKPEKRLYLGKDLRGQKKRVDNFKKKCHVFEASSIKI
jgi:hypothetical protein